LEAQLWITPHALARTGQGSSVGLPHRYGLQLETSCRDPEASRHVSLQRCPKTPNPASDQAVPAAPRMICLQATWRGVPTPSAGTQPQPAHRSPHTKSL
jgi:hypothetical protein